MNPTKPFKSIRASAKQGCIIFLTGLMSLPGCKSRPEKTEAVAATETTATPLKTVGAKMIWLKGRTFTMGSADPVFPDAKPLHTVTVSGFWMDEHEVTNAQFDSFVKATGYILSPNAN